MLQNAERQYYTSHHITSENLEASLKPPLFYLNEGFFLYQNSKLEAQIICAVSHPVPHVDFPEGVKPFWPHAAFGANRYSGIPPLEIPRRAIFVLREMFVCQCLGEQISFKTSRRAGQS
jgi:hypothetical protein